MSEVLWYYEEAGRQSGPVSHAALCEAIGQGRLPRGARVWRAGMAGWQPWDAQPELAALAATPPAAPPPLAPPPPGWGPPASGAPRPTAPGAAQATARPGGLDRVEVLPTILLSVVTLGIYGLVKFYQCGVAYARRLPARPSSFTRLFWIYLALGVATVPGHYLSTALGVLLALGHLGAGALLLHEVLLSRGALVAATGVRADLATPVTHQLLWVGGMVLSTILIGLFLLVAQAVVFFSDHDKLADALARRG